MDILGFMSIRTRQTVLQIKESIQTDLRNILHIPTRKYVLVFVKNQKQVLYISAAKSIHGMVRSNKTWGHCKVGPTAKDDAVRNKLRVKPFKGLQT